MRFMVYGLSVSQSFIWHGNSNTCIQEVVMRTFYISYVLHGIRYCKSFTAMTNIQAVSRLMASLSPRDKLGFKIKSIGLR